MISFISQLLSSSGIGGEYREIAEPEKLSYTFEFEAGAAESYDRLDELLAKLTQA